MHYVLNLSGRGNACRRGKGRGVGGSRLSEAYARTGLRAGAKLTGKGLKPFFMLTIRR